MYYEPLDSFNMMIRNDASEDNNEKRNKFIRQDKFTRLTFLNDLLLNIFLSIEKKFSNILSIYLIQVALLNGKIPIRFT